MSKAQLRSPSLMLILVAIALALAVADGATGQTLALRWNECAEGGGAGNKTFSCSGTLGEALCVPTLQLPTPADSVIGMEWVVDLVASTPTLPDWWQLGPGGCRAVGLTASNDLAGLGACADPWNGQGLSLVQVFETTQPRGGANQARIVCSSIVLASQLVQLDAGTSYYPGVLRLNYSQSVGANACSGCTTSVCLVFNSVRLLRHPAALAEDLFFVPGASDSYTVSWQGAGANCNLVPVRNRTWGALKSLYRQESR